jgi:hypothetical protein
MNHNEVVLIGVFDPEGKQEAWVYSVDAPINLWVGALCDDGSRMGADFMAHVLNELLEADAFYEGDTVEIKNQSGVSLTATVGPEVPARSVEAFQALTDTVRKVTVHVGE